jgi:S-DNA-T family DNA segregation ATPase FtsK/SpoIIIE
MEGRFEDFSQEKVRNIEEYNQKAEKEKIQKIPYIVLIIDELADIMIQRGKEIEAKIVKLAQKARAVGIHLILATQRPSAEILTGLIKTNITSRIAFQVPSQVDSRTILDTSGAEKLLGLGDMLFLSPEIGKPKRIQAPFVSQAEIKRIVEWLKNNVERPKEDFLAQTLQEALKRTEKREVYLDIDDPLIEEAKKLIFQTKRASASFLQRRLKIGYARAARILDILEQMGIVGKADGAKPREVYLPDDWKEC